MMPLARTMKLRPMPDIHSLPPCIILQYCIENPQTRIVIHLVNNFARFGPKYDRLVSVIWIDVTTYTVAASPKAH